MTQDKLQSGNTMNQKDGGVPLAETALIETENVESEIEFKYPDHFPPGCPPDDAEPASGEVYRVVRKTTPDNDDFMTQHEMNRMHRACQCLRRGISVTSEIEDAFHLMRTVSGVGDYIVKKQLSPQDGVMKPTPMKERPSHVTWWAFDGVERGKNCTLIEEDDNG